MGAVAQTAIDSGVVERVPAHDLSVGDHIIVDAVGGEYIGRISEIVEYAVYHPTTSSVGLNQVRGPEANTRCLCIRLPHLNMYRMVYDTVRRLSKA